MALNVSDIAKKVGIDWLYFAQLLNLGKQKNFQILIVRIEIIFKDTLLSL